MVIALRPLHAFLHLLREGSPGRIVLLLALMLMSSLTEGIGIVLLVPLLDMLQGTAEPGNTQTRMIATGLSAIGLPVSAAGVLAMFMGLILVRAAVQYNQTILGARLQFDTVDRLRQRCFAALLATEWRWIAGQRQSDQANLLLTDVSRVGVGLNFTLGLAATAATMGAYFVAAFTLSWPMTASALVGGGLVLLALSNQHRKAVHLGRSLTTANQSLHGAVHESLGGMKLAKILGSERAHLALFVDATRRLREQIVDFMRNTALSQALFQVGGAAVLALYLYAGLTLWQVPVAKLLILVLVFARLIPMFSLAQQQYHQLLHAFPALQQVERLLKECHAAAEPATTADRTPWPVRDAIALSTVTVQYADRDRPALDAISARLPARTTTAVIGASGAGKSTLADVLMGLLSPDQGTLTIDGAPIAGAERMRWRHSVDYVPQEVFLFNDSIRRNLLWGRSDAGEDDLNLALRRASADFVFDLPQGLETVVGDGGVRLSGGERQRLALARALLKQPTLLILDEATSALDMENEARVREAIETLHGDLIVVAIGHRLATLDHADQVIVLADGRIAAQGTWTEVRSHMERPA